MLGELVGMSGAAICNLETGRRPVSVKRVREVADALGVDADHLLSLRDQESTRELQRWLAKHPEVVAVLQRARMTGEPVLIGECKCGGRSS